MELGILWLQLALAAGIILGAAQFLAKATDIIGEKTGLGRSFVGVVLLATATSLPELGTGVSSIVLLDQPDLAAGDAFGSNLFNLVIIGLLDLFWRRGPILNSISYTSVIIAALGIGVISFAVMGIYMHQASAAFTGWITSPFTLVMFGIFVASMYLIYRHEKMAGEEKEADHVPDEKLYEGASLTRAVLTYALAAGVVVAAAIWLARTGEHITEEMGWQASFFGTMFLAFSTSLPELAASFAAIRLGAPELAVSNVLGSNLFNMGFILFLDDLAYADGVLWRNISDIHMLTGVFAIAMTAVVMIGILTKNRGRIAGGLWTIEGAVLVTLYVAATIFVFSFG